MKRLLIAAALALSLLAPGAPARAAQDSTVTPGSPLTMAGLAAFLNSAFATIGTNFSGATPPATYTGSAQTYQFWLDTSTSPRVLRINDGTQWVLVGSLDTAAHAFTVSVSQTPSTQTGTTYTATDGAKGSLVRFTNVGAVAVTQPQPGVSFTAGWFIDYRNASTGTVTITSTLSTIDGAASLVLPPGRSVRIVSDGTNYFSGQTVGTPTTAVLGGVFSKAAVTSNWLRSLGTDGIFTASQPAFTDLSGSAACAQLPALTGDVTTSAGACATTLVTAQPSAHTWAAVQTFTLAPVFTDASGSRTALGLGTAATQNTGTSGANLPFLNGTNTWAGVQTFTLAPVFTDASGTRTALGLSALATTTPGTGVATALGVNIGTAGSFVVNGGVLGTPSSGVATNLTGTAAGLTAGNVTTNANLTGDVTSVGNASTLVTAQPGAHTWAAVQTFTLAPVFTDASGSRTALGLGTAATQNTGTSGATLPFANTANTWLLAQTFTAAPVFTDASGTRTALGLSALATTVPGTGVATALGINVGSAGAFVTFNGALGTPSSGTGTNLTGVPISTGISGLGTGVAAFLATPSSANLAAALTDETGSGAAVFGTAPTVSAAILTGLVDAQGAVKFSTQSAPAQITSSQNNYNPSSVICATSGTLLINSNGAVDITGLAGGVAGCEVALINNGSFAFTLKEQSASSTATNRFASGGDISLPSSGGVLLRYDGAATRWRLLGTSSGGGGGGGSGTVTSVVAGDGLNGGTITTSGTISAKWARSFMLPL